MQLTINAGGIMGALSVMDLQDQMESMLQKTSDVIGSFKIIKNDTYSLSGGVGVLQNALDNIDIRIEQESRKLVEQEDFKATVEEFLGLATDVDANVAKTMAVNEEKFYQLHPGLRPVVEAEEEQSWLDAAWGWLCSVGEEVGNFLSEAGEWIVEKVAEGWEAVKEGAVKLWNCAVEFYTQHKKIIDTILIVAGAVLSIVAIVASGGTALVGLLGLVGITGTAAATISAVVAGVAVVTTVAATSLNVVDVWAEVDHPMFNSFQTVFNVTSGVTTLVYDIGEIFDTFKTAFAKRAAKKAAKEAAESGADDVLKAIPDNPPDGLMKNAADGLDDGVDDALKVNTEVETYDPRMDEFDNLNDYYESLDQGGPKNMTKTVEDSNAQYPKGGGDYIDDLLEIKQYPDGRYVPGEKGIVTKGDSQVLNRNLNKQMGLSKNPKGYQNAHIIPSELGDHRVIQEIGMDMNHASNGIKLPDTAGHTLSQHKGNHTIYTEFVESRLDELGKKADSLNLTPDQRYDFLQRGVRDIQIDSRKLLQEGLPGYKTKNISEIVDSRSMKTLMNDNPSTLLDKILEDRMKQDRTSFDSWMRNFLRISKDPEFSNLAQNVMGISK